MLIAIFKPFYEVVRVKQEPWEHAPSENGGDAKDVLAGFYNWDVKSRLYFPCITVYFPVL